VGSREGKNRGKPSPRKIYGEAVLNPRPGDSVRQLSPLHQACPSARKYCNKEKKLQENFVVYTSLGVFSL